MYTIKAFVDGKEYMIHNPRVKALIVGDPYYQKGDNVNGQAEFSVYPTHPYYQYVKKLTTDIVFYKDGVENLLGEFSMMTKIPRVLRKYSSKENLPIFVTAFRGRQCIIIFRSRIT